jgi:hypothetical protein
MTIYHFTSTTFTGYVEFRFTDADLLDKYEICADLSEAQQTFLLRHLPRDRAELRDLLAKSNAATLTEIKQVVTFEMFWTKYDDKINSSRKRTLQKWDKLTPADQARAYWYIDKYFGSIPPGTRKKFAETYLNAELWNN